MTAHYAVPGLVASGYSIGMLCAEWNIPFVPGDLNNATTFDFPVHYATVPGADGASILGGDAELHTAKFVQAARELEALGVRAITSNCGYMAAYQEAIAEAVTIPVFMSSLMQAPLLGAMLGVDAQLGVVVANSASVDERMLTQAGILHPERLVIAGLEHHPHWNAAIIREEGVLDPHIVRSEVLDTVQQLVAEHPAVAAILLECSDLPPYARAVAAETGLAVFDWANFIRWVHAACEPRSYPAAFAAEI